MSTNRKIMIAAVVVAFVGGFFPSLMAPYFALVAILIVLLRIMVLVEKKS